MMTFACLSTCYLFYGRLLYASSIPEDLPEEDPEGPDVTLHSVLVVQNGLCSGGREKQQNLAENLGILLEPQKIIRRDRGAWWFVKDIVSRYLIYFGGLYIGSMLYFFMHADGLKRVAAFELKNQEHFLLVFKQKKLLILTFIQ
jgi:hypothetical protein